MLLDAVEQGRCCGGRLRRRARLAAGRRRERGDADDHDGEAGRGEQAPGTRCAARWQRPRRARRRHAPRGAARAARRLVGVGWLDIRIPPGGRSTGAGAPAGMAARADAGDPSAAARGGRPGRSAERGRAAARRGEREQRARAPRRRRGDGPRCGCDELRPRRGRPQRARPARPQRARPAARARAPRRRVRRRGAARASRRRAPRRRPARPPAAPGRRRRPPRRRSRAATAARAAGERAGGCPADRDGERRGVEHEQHHAGDAEPAMAGGLEAALRPRCAGERRARMVDAEREERDEGERAHGQRDPVHHAAAKHARFKRGSTDAG